MKKVEIKIPGDNTAWGTLKTKYPADTEFVGQNELTGDSKNIDSSVKGILTKRKDAVQYNPTSFGSAPKDQYEAIFSDGVRHLLVVAGGTLKYSSGGGTFTDVTSGYSANGNFEFTIYDDRVYFSNGINNPQVYDRNSTYGGVVYSPVPKTKDMGAQAPASAVTFAADTAGGSVPAGGHTYKVTYLYYDGEESNGGPASTLHTVVNPNNTVNLTAIPVGGYGVTARKIYRDDNDGVYRLITTILNNTSTTYSDTAAVGTELIPLTNDVPPSFRYIVTHLDRNWIAGITGDTSLLQFSEAGLPNIFPDANNILCNPKDPITGLVVFNDRIIIFNRNSIGQITGRTKDTFRYSEIPSAIGCVDNRSIQIRTIVGVPTLMWLSDKGFYSYNGSSVNYISDPIEDLVNLNIQQSQQVKGQNAQTTQSQFAAGTASPAISVAGGVITTPNPTRTWDDEADWEGGTVVSNIATNLNNQISVPTKHSPTFAQGSHNNTVEISGTLRTPLATNFTGESFTVPIYQMSGINTFRGVARSFTPSRSGTLTSFVVTGSGGSGSIINTARVWSNLAGAPGSVLFSFVTPDVAQADYTVACSIALTGGTTYWIGFESNTSSTILYGNNQTFTGGNILVKDFGSGSWVSVNYSGAYGGMSRTYAYTFTQAAVSTSGLWIGPTHDTYANAAIPDTLSHTGSFPAGTSSVTTLEAANDSGFTSGLLTQTFNNLNGSSAVTITDRRYWRIKMSLATTDDRYTAQLGVPTLTYNTTGTWESEVLDHTTDITTLDLLNIMGTGGTVTIATSAVNTGPWTFVALGSATPLQYSKVRIVLTTDGGNTTSQIVTSARFNWSLLSNLISSNIDTGTTPAGWDIFQADSVLNGGTLLFEMRSASSIPGLTGATWYTVTNGAFPATPVERYVNWRVTIGSSADAVPTVDSVAVNWFISNVNSIRVASLFYNRSYFFAAAEYSQTANNLVLVFDAEGNWRLYRDLSIATFSLFFNDPYYGSSTEGKIYRFLQGNTNVIEAIVDTKEFDLGYPDKTKIMRNVRINGNATGAKYYVQFSADGGFTWIDMYDPYTGLTYIQTLADGSKFSNKFVPMYTEGLTTAGRSLKIRVKESTAAEMELESIKSEMWIRAGERNG